MSKEQIIEKLREFFAEGKYPAVLWYDDKAEFANTIKEIEIPAVQIIHLDEVGYLVTKETLHNADSEEQFLVYSSKPRPKQHDDWLLDCFFYGKEFSADRATLIRDKLGLQTSSHRQFIERHDTFFDSKKRTEAVKRLVQPGDNEELLADKMLAVTVGVASHTIEYITLALLADQAKCNGKSEVWDLVVKFKFEEHFWATIKKKYRYSASIDTASLDDLARHLFVSELALQLGTELPDSLSNFVLSDSRGVNSTRVLLTDWQEKEKYRDSYLWWSKKLEEELSLSEKLYTLPLDALVEVTTFRCFEQEILNRLRELLIEDEAEALVTIPSIITVRRNTFWPQIETALQNGYIAINAASELAALKEKHKSGFPQASPGEFVQTYCNELYRFDSTYRSFYTALREGGIRDFAEPLKQKVESLYTGWFLNEVSRIWGNNLTDGLLANYKVPGLIPQREFFQEHVAPVIKGKQVKRIVVIISDALRYEAAQELSGRINGRDSRTAEVKTMLGILPSYTKLGMAALLPNKELTIDKKGDISVDGKRSASIEQRSTILKKVDGVAIAATQLMNMGRDERREFVGDKMLVYVYHNIIDDLGDKQVSESRTFEAVKSTISELDRLVSAVLNSMNTSTVLVTTDHGFVYLDTKLEEAQKTNLSDIDGEVTKAHKRFYIGENLTTESQVYKAKLAELSGIKGDLDVLFPKGYNRFNFVGGARFFHGGPMPQEVILPVIKIRKFRDKAAEKVKTRSVGVTSLHASETITSQRQTFKFIQTELVTDKILPVTVRVGFYDGDNLVSDSHVLTFDATREENREQSVTFTFRNQEYNKTKDYFLKIIDEQTNIEQPRKYAFKIRIMLVDDFDGF